MREVGTIIDLYTEANREYLQLLLGGDHTKIMEKLTCLKELHKPDKSQALWHNIVVNLLD